MIIQKWLNYEEAWLMSCTWWCVEEYPKSCQPPYFKESTLYHWQILVQLILMLTCLFLECTRAMYEFMLPFCWTIELTLKLYRLISLLMLGDYFHLISSLVAWTGKLLAIYIFISVAGNKQIIILGYIQFIPCNYNKFFSRCNTII